MGDRYWVSGVQVALLLTADFLKPEQRKELIDEIQDNQWLGDKKAVKKLLKNLEKKK
jgi:hypothetical protein